MASALFGLVGMGLAVLIHEGSTIIVALNAMRLLKFDG
jgi:cation transport ATPase